jgi:hypothetical protein
MSKSDELSFLEFLQSFRRGELLSDADQSLTELIEAVERTGGSGSLTIRLPFKKNKAGQLECVPAVELKKPKRAMGTGIYYATADARLTRKDPSQMDLIDELEARRERADLQ